MTAQPAGDKGQDKSQVQVIARAATILRALEDENSGLSLGQIAKRVNLARSTVQRIVAALSAEKFVMAATPTGRSGSHMGSRRRIVTRRAGVLTRSPFDVGPIG